ncbi:MAG: CCA tRNA nucleotidyltransferase [Planctomycetes bacterium]|nr:CCA tRNA nucleotidyltransferase [Planctomycetota bacterium]
MSETPIPPAPPEETEQPRRVRAEALTPDRLDPDALKVVQRLGRFGFEAYLVGGCVRDLLLGRSPKDFDVATSARPRQIKRVFRNCRIIGRRFKLAHVVFGDRVVETATFRRRPQGLEEERSDLLITDDNLFGDAAEDARRRDFTINGLFFDPTSGEVIDFVGGLEDLEKGMLRTIGDPWVRFREDPVRILRAIKFASRLGFQLDPAIRQAMGDLAGDIARGAPPRVLEEVYRLMRSGTSLGAFRLLREIGALRVVLPEIEDFLAGEEASPEGRERIELFWRYLEGLDSVVHESGEPPNSLLVATVFVHLVRRESDPARRRSPGPPPQDPGQVVDDVLAPVCLRLRLSRNDAGRARRLCIALKKFLQRPGRRFRPNAFMRQEYFDEALALLRVHCTAEGSSWHVYESWAERRARFDGSGGRVHGRGGAGADEEFRDERPIDAIVEESPEPRPLHPAAPPHGGKRSKRRRRRGRRRGGAPHAPPSSHAASHSPGPSHSPTPSPSPAPASAPPPPRPEPLARDAGGAGWGSDW